MLMFWISILCMGHLHTAHLWKQGPLVTFELQAVNNKPFHRLGWGTIQLTEVWRQVTTTNHKDYLRKRTEREQLLKAGERYTTIICMWWLHLLGHVEKQSGLEKMISVVFYTHCHDIWCRYSWFPQKEPWRLCVAQNNITTVPRAPKFKVCSIIVYGNIF